jgi:hypothetical protein
LDRRKLLGVGLAGVGAACLPAPANAQRRLWGIGYHSAGSAQSNSGWLDAFRKGMSELGRSESRDYVIDARTAKALGVAIPQSVMLRADRVIE